MNGVLYFNHGRTHLIRLAVSLFSLRRYWQGRVLIADTGFAGDGRDATPEVLALARHFHCDTLLINPSHGKYGHYATKAWLWRRCHFDVTVQLDADTLVAGSIDKLFEIAGRGQLLLTRFSDWTTERANIKARINKWRNINLPLVRRARDEVHVAINTGVLAYDRSLDVQDALDQWDKLTTEGRELFMCDEIAMQLLVPTLRERIAIVNDRWNFSPVYGINNNPVHIHHFHGGKHLNPGAGGVWLEAYQQCLAENVAGIREWPRTGEAVAA